MMNLLLYFYLFLEGILSCKSVSVLNNPIDAITDSTAVTVSDDFSAECKDWLFKYGSWNYKFDKINQFLQHSSDETYGVALFNQVFNDVDISVRFRPINGNSDQAGGIIFRAKDENNYYLVRANGLENNFRFYITTNGDRQELASSTVNTPAQNQWHTIRVIMKKQHLQAFLDRQMFLDTFDNSLNNGLVGLWTKADSQTDFDDFVVKGTKK